jgi:hypothetical protein
MKKIALLTVAIFMIGLVSAQDSTDIKGSKLTTVSLNKRPGDHLMLQFGLDGWSNMPDSISSHQKGFSRGFNMYFMFDKVFKSSPKFSFGIGVGVSTSNISFKKMDVQLNAINPTLPFIAVDSTDHFKKYKLSTTFLEIPLELRYTAHPDRFNKSLKAAIGVKLGTMVKAQTKGKTLVNKNNNTLNSYTEKISSKRFMNTTRFMATARVGYGIVSLFGAYGLSNILKDGVGPAMKPYQIGITLSGL